METNDIIQAVKKKIKSDIKRILKPELFQMIKGPLRVLEKKDFFQPAMFDVNYLIYIFLLLTYGLVIHYSASYSTLQQVLFALGGLVAMVVVSQLSLNMLKETSTALMVLATVFLFLVLSSTDYNGTHRWLWFFQPSEFGKITLILFLAYLIDKYSTKTTKFSTFIVFFVIVISYALLVLAESHLSGCILFFLIGYSMMWYGNMSKKLFLIVTVVGISAVLLIVLKPEIVSPIIKEYQLDRIVIWKKILFNGEITAKEKLDNARQVLQSLYGIGSGGLSGVGFGESGQKVSNLSEESNDFIFAVLGEELGFIGSAIMLALFGALVVRGFKIGLRSESVFGTLVAFGISTQMALQVLINVAVATSLLPNTGISLPFFSDGGSSMVITMVSMGIVLCVSKKDKRKVKKNAEQ